MSRIIPTVFNLALSIHNPHCHDHVAAEWAAFDAGYDFSVFPRHHAPMPGRPNGVDYDMDDNEIRSTERGLPWTPAPGTAARFWVSYGGGLTALVKLRAGQSISHVDGGSTDEGYDYTVRTWSFDGDEVTVSYCNYAQDCDGPITRGGESFCSLADLQEGYRCPDDLQYPFARNGVIIPIIFPKWRERGRAFQRDAFAEAAGY